MKQLLRFTNQLLWPHYCLCCHTLTHSDHYLCNDCNAQLPRIEHSCSCCAQPLDPSLPTNLCNECRAQNKESRIITTTQAPFFYQPPIAGLLMGLKFSKRVINSRALGQLMIDHLKKNTFEKPDLIIPMPLHKKRLHERGFNQALEIAKPIARYFKIPLDNHSVIRCKHTTPQTTLSAKQRQINLLEAFAIKKPFTVKHLVIFDDVITTGATVKNLAALLKNNGCERIDVYCIARSKL